MDRLVLDRLAESLKSLLCQQKSCSQTVALVFAVFVVFYS